MRIAKLLNLIEEKREEILVALENAFCESIDNRHLEFLVQLYADGDIEVWYSNSGSNSYKGSSLTGESICIGSFCNTCLETENNGDDGETEEEWIDWYKDFYKTEEAENKLKNCIEMLNMLEED